MNCYKESLPINCPPLSSLENDDSLILYRVVNTNILSESDFLPYSRLYPDNPRYKTCCDAHGVSFYSNPEVAKNKCLEIYKKGKKLGVFIAKVKFKLNNLGKYKCTEQTAHCNFWFYSITNIESDLEYLELVNISYDNR